MKHIAMFVLGVTMVSTNSLAQEPADAIAQALSALPAALRDGAGVIKWKSDFTYDTLKKGTSRLVCYDRSGFPEQQPFSIECTSIANLDREAQNLKFEAVGDRSKTAAMIDAAEKGGTRVKPEYGSVWYHLAGSDRKHAQPLVTIAVPGATTQSIGLPESPSRGRAWIMDPGTTTAHLMIPGE
jgi:hypothetical protein